MQRPKPPKPGNLAELRRLALAFPEVEEGVTCDKAAFKARGKAFLFVGRGDSTDTVMLKLRNLLPEAKKLAASHPATYQVGGHNWVTIVLPHNQPPSVELLKAWIDESYRLLVPRALVAIHDDAAQATPKNAKKR